ncbi:hypothetical protein GE09DRAFT_353320 [Coniochaeta sp. 2T2.1]|nr:hypothetical protein GE09DRAFT_353320 [Coniochaeta sp. 2T2.1]
MSIRTQPFEVIALIVGYLDLDDVYNLSICSRHFRSLAYDQAICKKVLQTGSSSALEAQQAHLDRDYARGLRRLIKRREAISSASPFLTAVVAFAESWSYENGVLCHIRERQLRLLDVHHSADKEIVVDIRKLLDEAVPESKGSRKYKFQLLYQADGIVSCLYTHARPHPAHWLVVFNPREGIILTTRRLDSAYKIFARSNSDFLYYGVQSDIGDDGFRRWVLEGFDIRQAAWYEDSLNLPDTVGSDIDSTICFEIIDGYFCVLTNNTSFELDKIGYTSYYDFLRFPLGRPGRGYIERPTKRNLFRRQHSEGPIDDRWTFMKIFCDELSGELKILESRKEWLAGNSTATRTYYTKTLHMTERSEARSSSSWSDEEEGEDQYTENDRLAQFLGTASKSNKGGAPSRDPGEVHVGDDGATSVMFTLSKCFIRSYHPSSHTFMDLVDDPHESDPCGQQIRIRAGTRLPRARSGQDGRSLFVETPEQHHMQTQTQTQTQEQLDNHYEQSGVVYCPPEGRSRALDYLHNVLNPPGYAGNVQGTWDTRSLIYATGGEGNGGVKALVLVSFDPSIYLRGSRSFKHSASVGENDLAARLRNIQVSLSPEASKGKEKGTEADIVYACPSILDEEVVVEHRTSASAGSGLGSRGRGCSVVEAGTHAWASYEPAQHLTINMGLHFAESGMPV